MRQRAGAAQVCARFLLAVLCVAPSVAVGDGRVVILLGETDAYLAAASRYWSAQWSPRHVVHGIGSLAELREVLATHPLRGDEAWREVVIVSHASEWSGLPVPLHPQEEEATPATLIVARQTGAFPALRPSILDAQTELRLEGCGIGRRSDILEALAGLLAGDLDVAVAASSNLVAYVDDGAAAVRRLELPYAARTVRSPQSADAVLNELIEEVRTALDPDLALTLRHELRPVGVRIPLPTALAHSGQRAERIAYRYEPLRRRLGELGFRAAQLHWRIDFDGVAGSAELVGEAHVLVVTPDVGLSEPLRAAP